VRSALARARNRIAILAVTLVAAGFAPALTAPAAATSYTVTQQFVSVPAGPGSTDTINLWTSFYVPSGADATHQVPVVLLTHGWGNRHDAGWELQASQFLASHGYAVIGWDSRGFGNSEGWVELDSPDYEVQDARRMLDLAASLPYVLTDAPGDPRAGMVGVSYAGGVQLLTAAFDDRLDAIVPVITWNDLARSLAPDGVVKMDWVTLLFGAGTVSGLVGDTPPNQGSHLPDATVDPILADFFVNGLAQGTLSQQALDALRYRSPSTYIDRIHTPALLVQGEGDTLFPWNEAVANYNGIHANGTPVKLIEQQFGHSQAAAPGEMAFAGGAGDLFGSEVLTWFARYLDADTTVTTGNNVKVRTDWLPTDPANASAPFLGMSAPLAPNTTYYLNATAGALGTTPSAAGSATVVQPALPASYSEFSNFSDTGGPGDQQAFDAPGTVATFDTPALTSPVDVLGIPHATFTVSSTTTDTVLFVKLYDVAPDGTATLVRRTVQAVRLQTNPVGLPALVDVDLIGAGHRWDVGHKLRLAVAATDAAFINTRQPGVYTIRTGGTTGATLRLPTV
jgi:ABC-2 type transport system ATP-binding protein